MTRPGIVRAHPATADAPEKRSGAEGVKALRARCSGLAALSEERNA
jgi:hypothetical protein